MFGKSVFWLSAASVAAGVVFAKDVHLVQGAAVVIGVVAVPVLLLAWRADRA